MKTDLWGELKHLFDYANAGSRSRGIYGRKKTVRPQKMIGRCHNFNIPSRWRVSR